MNPFRITSAENEKAAARAAVPHVSTIGADEIQYANRPSTQMLLAISATGKHLYPGTVDPVLVARRRAANRRARAARRVHRKAAHR